MKILGLISGGKDSVYNLLLCQDYGHEIIALANLYPSDESVDELDSYMYQTVGHQMLEAYATCAELPLFRRRIQGTSRYKALEYSTTAGDEVEDLVSLVSFALQQLPGIEAVASGAIASDYQRLRVEHVCARLGLTSLAYLWRQTQTDLLQAMIDAGIEAVLVKVAALGLDPSRHLGRDIRAMQPTLHQLSRDFGCNVCGEGGEYETLTLDCSLFRAARIAVESWTIFRHSEGEVASVGVARPAAFSLQPKRQRPPGDTAGRSTEGLGGRGRVIEVPVTYGPPQPVVAAAAGALRDVAGAGADTRSSGRLVSAFCAPVIVGDGGADCLREAMRLALTAIAEELASRGARLEEAVAVSVWMADIALFATMNAEYAAHFSASRPAVRACVQAELPVSTPAAVQVVAAAEGATHSLPHATEVIIDILLIGGTPRRVLHVQSVSRWAPSCIGPYSQCVAGHGLAFFAGQIGLDPPTMRLLSGTHAQAQQCFKSCEARSPANTCRCQDSRRSSRVVSAAWASGFLSCMYWSDMALLPVTLHHRAVAIAMRIHLQSSLLGITLFASSEAGHKGLRALDSELQSLLSPSPSEDEGQAANAQTERVPTDQYLSVEARSRRCEPVPTFLIVPELPRGAAVEAQPLARTAEVDDDTSGSGSDDAGQPAATGPRNLARHLRNFQKVDASVSTYAVYSMGSFCRCTVSHSSSPSHESYENGAPTHIQSADLPRAAERIARAAAEVLSVACLHAGDVLCAQLFTAPCVPVGDAGRALERGLGGVGLAGLTAAVIPVTAVGPTAEAASDMLLELLCVT